MNADGYDSSVVEYKWFHPKEEAVQFDPGSKELPHMVIHDFVLKDCSYNDTSSQSPTLLLSFISPHIRKDLGCDYLQSSCTQLSLHL